MGKIEDIKIIRARTDFGISDCQEAYEKNDCDVEKAVQYLLSMAEPDTSVKMSDEDAAELAKYKRAAEKRADRYSKPKIASKKKTAIVYLLFSAAFLLLIIAGVIISISEHSFSYGFILIPILPFAICLFAGIAIYKMSDETYNNATEIKNTEIITRDDEPIICPHCGSVHLTYQKKGFSEAKALIGMSLIGLWGVFFGVPGKNKIRATCLKCGHSFMIKKDNSESPNNRIK